MDWLYEYVKLIPKLLVAKLVCGYKANKHVQWPTIYKRQQNSCIKIQTVAAKSLTAPH